MSVTWFVLGFVIGFILGWFISYILHRSKAIGRLIIDKRLDSNDLYKFEFDCSLGEIELAKEIIFNVEVKE